MAEQYFETGIRMELTQEQLSRREKILTIWRRTFGMPDTELLVADAKGWEFLEALIAHKDN
jgi:hypothetical protein